jgi:hypothetical protein
MRNISKLVSLFSRYVTQLDPKIPYFEGLSLLRASWMGLSATNP